MRTTYQTESNLGRGPSYRRMYTKTRTGPEIELEHDTEIANKFDDVIQSDKLEHIKPKKKVLKEIYDNTERKVLHN